ncbi:MAG: FapA family protein [Treponema sp.]|uniref:FapA family protein n=1 Tax=Treponema sp. TaxID=166 RepID=UPI001B695C90|nr:FapA family protein [Treponema sp.]MBP3771615.1 FapA family protein [Treponema sp.]MBQ9281527.1 FapA family protein [Treponema sp.]
MVTLDAIRKDMAGFLEKDKEIHFIEVRADTLDEALADAAVQFDTRVANLEYEVLERGFDGFMGIAKKPWFLKIYQNPDTVKKVVVGKNGEVIESEDEEDIQKIVSRDGEYYIHHFGTDIMLKVLPPVGDGKPVDADVVLEDLNRPDTANFNADLVRTLVKNGSEEYQVIGEYNHEASADAIFVIDISNDEMKATATINPPSIGGADITVEQIKKALTQQGVVAGISDEKIQALVDKPSYNEPVVVAEAVLPIDGKDAYITYNFETDRSKIRAKQAANGQVDFKELNLIQNVVEGQPLAQKMLAEQGKPGKTLYGRYLEAKNGRDIQLPLGKNVRVDSDGRTILADANGQVLLINDKVCVEPIMEVDGVNIKTGNITFLGTVIVKGAVEDGFNVKASGNIEVSGTVGKCTLESDGDIIVSSGIIGRDEGRIVCGGSLWAKFIQNTTVQVEENIIVTDSIMNSEVSAQKKIILNGKRAQITGGNLFATEAVIAKNIGSEGGGTETVISVGFDPRAKKRLEELLEMQNNNIKILDDLELNIATLDNMKKVRKSLPKEKEESLVSLNEQKNEILEENIRYNEEIEKIQGRLRELKNIGKVYASGTVYSGVKIFVRDEKDEIRADTKSVIFFYEDGFVRRGKYEQPNLEDIKGPEGYS